MPVDISDYESLEPFLTYLSKNKEIIPNHEYRSKDLATDNNLSEEKNVKNCMKFEKGALYTDGRMDLCKQVVGPTWIEKLMLSLTDNDKITHFLLGNNIIGTKGAKSISDFLLNTHKPKIETRYLAGNDIDHEGIKMIVKGLIGDKDMKYLWLKRNPLYANGIKYIADLLKYNDNIKILDLHNTAMFDEGLNNLVVGLNENNSLRHLYICANGISNINSLCDYFKNKSSKGITSLWMDLNRIGDEEMSKLLISLKNYPYLKRLFIGSCGLTSKITETIYECFKDSKSLKVLNLGMYKSTNDMGEVANKIGDDGCIYIGKLIKENKSIQFMDLNYNCITEKGIEILNESLKDNDTLLFLNVIQFVLDYNSKAYLLLRDKLKNNIKNMNYKKEKIENITRYLKHSSKIQLIDSIYRNKM